VSRSKAGDIVLVDWRDAMPKEANKHRPAIVVEDSELFDDTYPNVLLVPLTDDEKLAFSQFSVVIEPSRENGCSKRSYALSHVITATSRRRTRTTPSRISSDQLRQIRRYIIEAIGVETIGS
jgi:mRNA-degrading endonuclease toxin of MazEF toxin-antitoxin module